MHEDAEAVGRLSTELPNLALPVDAFLAKVPGKDGHGSVRAPPALPLSPPTMFITLACCHIHPRCLCTPMRVRTC